MTETAQEKPELTLDVPHLLAEIVLHDLLISNHFLGLTSIVDTHHQN